MKISHDAIDRPRLVLVATVLLVAMALIAAIDIPVQRTPAISKAVVLIAVPHPGAQPTTVEEEITRKIEDALQSLNDVDFISSTSMRGTSVTQVIFLDGVDPDQARGEVQDLVDRVRRELPTPREVQPIVTEIDFENAPLMLVNLTGPPNFDQRALKFIAEEVQEQLEGIPGVANTQLFGGREREIHVTIDPDLALQYGLTLDDFRTVLQNFHAVAPGGTLNTGTFDYQVRNDTKFDDIEDIRAIKIPTDSGQAIPLAEVATVSDTYRRLQNIAQLDGRDCATIIVNKEADINTLATAQAVKDLVGRLRQQYPHIKFSATRDTSADISVMFRVLGSSFVFGMMLVLVILAWSMSLRISLLVLLAIPFSSAVGLVCLYYLDIPVSNMVIFAFILALGMVVDGAIIVAENIHRHVERGEDPVTAAKIGIEEVGMPVIIADLTTIAAFLPMLLVPGIMGDFMSVMPKVVSMSLLGSVLVDHFLIPTLAAYWYPRVAKEEGRVETLAEATGQPGSRREGSQTPEVRVRPNLGPFSRAYVGVLRWSLAHRWVVVVCGLLTLAWAGFMWKHIKFTFFPPSDRGQFEVKYELPLGTSIEQTILAAKAITDPLEELQREDGSSEVVSFVSAIGSSEGLASRLETDPAVGPEFGSVMVQLLSPLDRQRHEDEIIRELRSKIEKRIDEFPGMTYTISEVEEGPPGGYDVAVRLTGDDLPTLGRIAKQIAERMDRLPGTVDAGTDYRDDNPEIVVTAREWALGLFDLNNRAVAQAVQTAVNGDTSILMSIGDEDVTLRLQADSRVQESRQAIARLTLVSRPGGPRATIEQVAELRRNTGLYAVNRYKQKRAVVAKCNVQTPIEPDDIFKVLREEILPDLGFRNTVGDRVSYLGGPGTGVEGVRATFTGENEERDKNFGYLINSMGIAVVLIFAILVWQFNSFRQAWLVLLAVPLSFVGVIFGMWVSDFPFSLASFIGLVSLTGVVVNDAIVVVDFINQARARGLSVYDAIVEAGINRLRPVLLTTVTTIGGLLPLFGNWSGGAEFWQPLTGSVIFGLGFATILTLLVVPVGYSLMYSYQDRRQETLADSI